MVDNTDKLVKFYYGKKSLCAERHDDGLYFATDVPLIHSQGMWRGVSDAKLVGNELTITTGVSDVGSEVVEHLITVDLTAIASSLQDRNNWTSAYNFVKSITEDDTDNIINKWQEIVDFLAGISGTTLADIIAIKADKSTKIIAGVGLIGGGTLGEDVTISLGESGVSANTYTKVTVDKYGRVTKGATLVDSDIPTLQISKIQSLQSALDAKVNYSDIINDLNTQLTAKPLSANMGYQLRTMHDTLQETLSAHIDDFDELYRKIYSWFTPHYASDGTLESIEANVGFWTNSYVSAKGQNVDSGGTIGSVASIFLGTTQYTSDDEGNVRLPAYPTMLKNPYSLTIGNVTYDGSEPITILPTIGWEDITNKPTTIKGFGITDSIPIIDAKLIDSNTSLLNLITSGSKLAVAYNGNQALSWANAYSNTLFFRSNSDFWSGINIPFNIPTVTFLGGRDTEVQNTNIPNWYFKLSGSNGKTYALESFALTSSLSNYLPITGGTLSGNLTINGNLNVNDSKYIRGYFNQSQFSEKYYHSHLFAYNSKGYGMDSTALGYSSWVGIRNTDTDANDYPYVYWDYPTLTKITYNGTKCNALYVAKSEEISYTLGGETISLDTNWSGGGNFAIVLIVEKAYNQRIALPTTPTNKVFFIYDGKKLPKRESILRKIERTIGNKVYQELLCFVNDSTAMQPTAMEKNFQLLCPLKTKTSYTGDYSVSSGFSSVASGYSSVASGYASVASGFSSVASGNYSVASGYSSVASGNSSVASGDYSVASGYSSVASGNSSVASGNSSVASGYSSVAMGANCIAKGNYSFTAGNNNSATATCTMVLGEKNKAIYNWSNVFGYRCTSSHYFQTVIGRTNKQESGKLFIIGNGSSDQISDDNAVASNCFTVAENGDTWMSGILAAYGITSYDSATIKSTLNVDGLITANSGIRIGDVVLKYDANYNALYVQKYDGSKAGIYATDFVSAKGVGSVGTGGGGGIDLTSVWESLSNNTDDFANKKIHIGHIPKFATTQITDFTLQVNNLILDAITPISEDFSQLENRVQAVETQLVWIKVE